MKNVSRTATVLALFAFAGTTSLLIAASPAPSPSPSPTASPTAKPKRVPASPRPSPSGSPRAFTNEDLAAAGGGKGTVTVLPPPLFPLPSATPGSSNPLERQWRNRAENARRALQAAEAALLAAESRLSALTSDLDPNANVQDPNRLQTIEAERAKAVVARDAAVAAVAVARKGQEDLEEEARRAGIDRRWLSGNDR